MAVLGGTPVADGELKQKIWLDLYIARVAAGDTHAAADTYADTNTPSVFTSIKALEVVV